MHRWHKFGENVSNNLQDIVLTTFQDTRMDTRTHTRMNGTTTVCPWPHYVNHHTPNDPQQNYRPVQTAFIQHVDILDKDTEEWYNDLKRHTVHRGLAKWVNIPWHLFW